MDDFHTDPKSFYVLFSSIDDSVQAKNDGSYIFTLRKPLKFANKWEIGIKQLIIKSPYNSQSYSISYTLPDDEPKSFGFKELSLPQNANEFIDSINKMIPASIK